MAVPYNAKEYMASISDNIAVAAAKLRTAAQEKAKYANDLQAQTNIAKRQIAELEQQAKQSLQKSEELQRQVLALQQEGEQQRQRSDECYQALAAQKASLGESEELAKQFTEEARDLEQQAKDLEDQARQALEAEKSAQRLNGS